MAIMYATAGAAVGRWGSVVCGCLAAGGATLAMAKFQTYALDIYGVAFFGCFVLLVLASTHEHGAD